MGKCHKNTYSPICQTLFSPLTIVRRRQVRVGMASYRKSLLRSQWWKCYSCFMDTKYKCLRCELPICNKCSVFEENEDVEGWTAGKLYFSNSLTTLAVTIAAYRLNSMGTRAYSRILTKCNLWNRIDAGSTLAFTLEVTRPFVTPTFNLSDATWIRRLPQALKGKWVGSSLSGYLWTLEPFFFLTQKLFEKKHQIRDEWQDFERKGKLSVSVSERVE